MYMAYRERGIVVDQCIGKGSWGFEFAGKDFFFSLHGVKKNIKSYRNEVILHTDNHLVYKTTITIGNSVVTVSCEESVRGGDVRRSYSIETNRDILITGFAIRYLFDASDVTNVFMNNKQVLWNVGKKFNMLECNSISIVTGPLSEVSIETRKNELRKYRVTQYYYARKVDEKCVVHCRILPEKHNVHTSRIVRVPGRLQALFKNPLFEKALAKMINIDAIWDMLWHRTERQNFYVPFSAYGLFLLRSGEGFTLENQICLNQYLSDKS